VENIFGIIYKVTNKINNKCYIGQTVKRLMIRKCEHECRAMHKYGTCSYFHRAIRKYGQKNFVWDTLVFCKSKEELDLAEEWYIRYYKTFVGFDVCCGYNLTLGGEGSVGFVHTEASKKLISINKKGKYCGKDNPFFGHHHTIDVLRKISNANGGKNGFWYGKKIPKNIIEKRAESRSSKWLIVFPDSEEKIVKNLNKFCRKHSLNSGHMGAVSRGLRKQHKGYKCIKLEE